eukprot:CAMPEP_0113475566 /NCGR_PEP_ID=MMETSP0014_2-20120614/19189_1 /TAXON_ID=2857 /ORGANISM="Nitzschia sp." /LENGTH=454 /DNA_ID=CAMNT_0000368495 /DNA_START=29 /DNA_END=1393 /DNA_ORIENTATION=+ /assembly_acc=CAM_ASM_000159
MILPLLMKLMMAMVVLFLGSSTLGYCALLVYAFTQPSPLTTTTTTAATSTVGIASTVSRRGESERQESCLRINRVDVRFDFSAESSDQEEVVVGRRKKPKERTQQRLHTVDGVTCREVVNSGLPIIKTVTVLEATAESQEELVDEVLLLEDELQKVNDGGCGDGNGEKRRIENGDPYGAVLWPASWAVAKYLLSEEEDNKQLSGRNDDTTSTSVAAARRGSILLSDLHVVEIGTGTGLVSLALAKAGTQRIVATDYEPLPLKLVSYAAAECDNDELQHKLPQEQKVPKMTRIETQLFDICDFDTPVPTLSTSQSSSTGSTTLDTVNTNRLVVAADIMYEPVTGRAMARRVHEALCSGARVVVGDSPGRAGRAAFLEELQNLGGLPPGLCQFNKTVKGRRCIGPRHDLICGEGSTSVADSDLLDDDDDDNTYQELAVAILDLSPSDLIQPKTDRR